MRPDHLASWLRGYIITYDEFASAREVEVAFGLLTNRVGAKVSSAYEGGSGFLLGRPYRLGVMALCLRRLGRFGEASQHIEDAIGRAERTGEKAQLAELWRIKGELFLMPRRPERQEAEDSFVRSLAIARSQQAKGWELRSATSLARLWRDEGKRTEGRDLLAPIYGWFTEGFDTADLKEAKALLDELA